MRPTTTTAYCHVCGERIEGRPRYTVIDPALPPRRQERWVHRDCRETALLDRHAPEETT